MFIVKRFGYMNEVLYVEDDTKWTSDKSKAKTFDSIKEASFFADSAKIHKLYIEEVS